MKRAREEEEATARAEVEAARRAKEEEEKAREARELEVIARAREEERAGNEKLMEASHEPCTCTCLSPSGPTPGFAFTLSLGWVTLTPVQ